MGKSAKTSPSCLSTTSLVGISHLAVLDQGVSSPGLSTNRHEVLAASQESCEIKSLCSSVRGLEETNPLLLDVQVRTLDKPVGFILKRGRLPAHYGSRFLLVYMTRIT